MNRAPALEVARRELQDNAATWKLPLALALTTLLLVTGVLSLGTSYQEGAEAYRLVQDEFAGRDEETSAAALAHRVLAHPNPLALLVGGPAEAVRAAFAAPPEVSNATASARQDPVRLRFEAADLGTVGVGVLTLLAVLLSYDGVAGEKERGTLKVLLVNPLSRRDVLLGKYLGGMATILAPLGVALVAALAVARLVGVRFGPEDYARLALVIVFLALLVSAFVLIGLAVSSLTTRSPVAILALVVLWLVLVAGAGSVAAFGATVGSEARGLDDVLVEMRIIDEHYDLLREDLQREIGILEKRKSDQGGTLSRDDAARLDGLKRDLAAIPQRRADDTHALLDQHFRSRELDLRRAERLAALSPAEGYRSVAQTLAGTDYASVRQELDEFTVYLREVDALRAEHLAEGGTPGEFQPPAYRSAPQSLAADFARAAPFALALLAHNALAFVAAAVAFARYDVR